MKESDRKKIASLVAIGKTDEEIQIILGFDSKRIAKRRVQTWMKYHKAATRTYAVVKAIAAQEIDAAELARMTAIVLLCSLTMFTPPRIAPKSAPKRHTTEQIVRRAKLNEYEQYREVAA